MLRALMRPPCSTWGIWTGSWRPPATPDHFAHNPTALRALATCPSPVANTHPSVTPELLENHFHYPAPTDPAPGTRGLRTPSPEPTIAPPGLQSHCLASGRGGSTPAQNSAASVQSPASTVAAAAPARLAMGTPTPAVDAGNDQCAPNNQMAAK